MFVENKEHPASAWRDRLHEIVFESETLAGRVFDWLVIWMILLSLLVVSLESVREIREQYGKALFGVEISLTILFSVEYVLRLLAVRNPLKYALSFFGLVDLLAILPTYLSFFVPGTHYLLSIRVLRLLRIFRLLKLSEYISEGKVITSALIASRRKISVFLASVSAIITIFGATMYVVEGEENGFTSIPTSVYWAVVTLTTVGYGDLSPKTPLGKTIASIVMILGYAIIAVPTGIVTAELTRKSKQLSTQVCPECHSQDHDADAVFCKYCSAKL
ncbi:MAG TPA: ion transporter [Pyrinomonadaceae bacterium]|jgi:voltage-gated potassium channel